MKLQLSFLVFLFSTSLFILQAKAESFTMTQRIGMASVFLENCVKDSGRFVYKRDLAGNEVDPAEYNFLRHAGTLYALALAETTTSQAQRQEKIQKTTDYLIDCCLAPVAESTDMLAIWSIPSLRGKPNAPLQAKLGGTGLALAAFIQAKGVIPDLIETETLRKMGNFLLFMQNNDGSFVSKYIPDKEPPKYTGWQSLYYPGEAALGLIMLYEIDGSLVWLQAAIDALRYLGRKRESQEYVEADHWALLATERLFRQGDQLLQDGSPATIPWNGYQGKPSMKENLIRHVERIVDSMLAEQLGGSSSACLVGGFTEDGRVTPTATRLEGLLAAYSILPPGKRQERVVESIRRGMDFLTKNQIIEGKNRGGFSRYSLFCQDKGGKNGSSNEIRIDYVQHSLAAFIGYQQLLYPRQVPKQ